MSFSLNLKTTMAIRSMNAGGYATAAIQTRMSSAFIHYLELSNRSSFEFEKNSQRSSCNGSRMKVTMRDRSKNRKPLQKGRNLSIEAIQTVQALKRALKSSEKQQEVIHSKLSRLLKFDMMAILRELLRQDQSLLALMVFEEIQKEHWYKPQVSLYAEIIMVLARNGLHDDVDIIYLGLKNEKGRLGATAEDFHALLETLMSYNKITLAMDCYELMKEVGCDPDRLIFKLLVHNLESKGETALSESVRQEAYKYYGDSLEFGDEQEEMTKS